MTLLPSLMGYRMNSLCETTGFCESVEGRVVGCSFIITGYLVMVMSQVLMVMNHELMIISHVRMLISHVFVCLHMLM